MELAHSVEPVQDGRIHIEKSAVSVSRLGQRSRVQRRSEALHRSRLVMHESGNFVRLPPAGAAVRLMPTDKGHIFAAAAWIAFVAAVLLWLFFG
jgi:hypothetical protein